MLAFVDGSYYVLIFRQVSARGLTRVMLIHSISYHVSYLCGNTREVVRTPSSVDETIGPKEKCDICAALPRVRTYSLLTLKYYKYHVGPQRSIASVVYAKRGQGQKTSDKLVSISHLSTSVFHFVFQLFWLQFSVSKACSKVTFVISTFWTYA